MKKYTLIATTSFPGAESKSAKMDIIWDEFLPIVRFKEPSKYEVEGEELIETKEVVTLSKQLDRNKSTFKIWQITTEKRKLKLPFTIKKGNSGSKDDDGFIDLKISEKDEDIKIISKPQIKAQYNTEIEVELEINGKENKEFYLDFYARDDNDDELNIGEYTNVHCGRLKIIFNYCICTDWTIISPIIPANKFIGWGHAGITQNCYHYSLEQLRQAGHWVKSERWNKKWDGTKELNDHIYQIFLEADVAGMKKGAQKNQFIKGVEYLKKSIKNKIPIMVGVDDDIKLDNDDETTEHFIVIVGMGSDAKGNYFLFYDNAVGNSYIGTSANNKLYCKCKDSKLEGSGSSLNGYIQSTSKKKYTVTQIRETR